ncbi:alcohol dehydrogenase catalytic domain-containing protein [Agrococcus sp. KRD186]|uniref:alcohol dehydrogenase catalytic domain-containing protein n=1 Tax=Agrococcus sp. KRD186 TaxID=2729730 RepID=UPI0019D0F0C4|nr:alcohol dehydrogenase catalytic domain-containing protein [Agrococcus sp. KRD186]
MSKRLFFPGDRRVEVITAPERPAGRDEVTVRIEAAGVCGSDLHYLYRVPSEERGKPRLGVTINPDAVPGHEPAGTIVAVGDGVVGLSVGDRVIVHHISGCGHCSWCTRDLPMHCEGKRTYGFDIDGAFAETMVARARDVIRVPDDLSMTVAAYCACGAGTAYNALRKLAVTSLDTVVVYGLGPVGLAAVAFARDFGARVAAVDMSAERRELAEQAGADLVLSPAEGDAVAAIREWSGGGASVGLDASGNGRARHDLLDAMAVLGRLAFVGEGGNVDVDVSEQVIHKQLTVIGSWVFGLDELAGVLSYVSERNVDLGALVTDVYDIDDAAAAFAVADGAASGKIVITMGQTSGEAEATA